MHRYWICHTYHRGVYPNIKDLALIVCAYNATDIIPNVGQETKLVFTLHEVLK